MGCERASSYEASIDDEGYVIIKRIDTREHFKLCRLIPNLFPEAYCKICLHPIPRGGRCNAHLKDRERLDGTLAIGLYYTNETLPLVEQLEGSDHRLTKYILNLKSHKDVALLIGTAMAVILENKVYDIGPEDIDVVTYVPKYISEYKRDSGTGEVYNQAEVLAQIVSKAINKPLRQLVVKKSSLSLSGLGSDERYRQASEVYEVPDNLVGEIEGKRILLVDDVRTSGATGNAIAEKLKGANAKAVYLLVAGRATFKSQLIEAIQSLRRARAQ